ncbi:hypothetical protein IKU74_01840 [bacterium]|nr:hypothetical protein [bacterium]
MENNKILLISDNSEITQAFIEKLVLLRKFDELAILTDLEFCENVQNYSPSVVFLVESVDREITVQNIDLIKKSYENVSIIMIPLEKNYDFILSMYDRGVCDYIFSDTHPAEVLVKTINAIKLNNQAVLAGRNNSLLASTKAISLDNGFYTENYANELMLNVLDEADSFNSSFMIIACDELDRASFKQDVLADAISVSLRASDFVIQLNSGKFYIYLKNTNELGACVVFNKVKEKLYGQFRIKAGITDIAGRTFKDIEQRASVSLTDAMLGTSDYVTYKDREVLQSGSWLEEVDEKQKDFKLFKQLFLKKLEKVITPVFYRTQASYEGVLVDTKIEQYSHETQCIFHLKHPHQTSRLTIVYPGFAKAVVYITHSGWDSPGNKEIFLPLKQLTEPVLTDIIEKFINEFRSCIGI